MLTTASFAITVTLPISFCVSSLLKLDRGLPKYLYCLAFCLHLKSKEFADHKNGGIFDLLYSYAYGSRDSEKGVSSASPFSDRLKLPSLNGDRESE